jgi:hypothetical protein
MGLIDVPAKKGGARSKQKGIRMGWDARVLLLAGDYGVMLQVMGDGKRQQCMQLEMLACELLRYAQGVCKLYLHTMCSHCLHCAWLLDNITFRSKGLVLLAACMQGCLF